VLPRGPKYGLPRQVREERQKSVAAAYLRDRDFDYDPPDDLSRPVRDRPRDAGILGWYWCRHEVENYLIDPALVVLATAWDVDEYVAGVVAAARTIRHYQIARWVVGNVRQRMPPIYELNTRPDGLASDFDLPADFGEEPSRQWAISAVTAFRDRFCAVATDDAIAAEWARRAAVITEASCDRHQSALVWFSGKDLLGALQPWLQARGLPGAGLFRARLRDWVMTHPREALEALPEWQGLVGVLRA
jgi:hypothetical protein